MNYRHFVTPATFLALTSLLLSGCAETKKDDEQNDQPSNGVASLTLKPISQFAYAKEATKDVAEIVAFDKKTNQVFVINTAPETVSVLALSNEGKLDAITSTSAGAPTARKKASTPNITKSINLDALGDGPNSIAAYNGKVAVAIEKLKTSGDKGEQDRGIVAIFDATTLTKEAEITVGYLPDMLTYTPDGKYIIVANEGEPSKNNKADPEGSISIIDLQDGNKITEITFTDYNKGGSKTLPDSVRIFGKKDDGAGNLINSTVAEDLEPEYIAVAADSSKAWVSLQENNAIAEIDLSTKALTKIIGLGTKDYSLLENAFDLSDKDDKVLELQPNMNVVGMYQPDGIDTYQVNGVHYLVTANEGDSRDYKGFSEEKRAGKLDTGLIGDNLKTRVADKAQLGRLKVTTVDGKNIATGVYETLHSYGARSFSIWNMETNQRVFDSGNEFIRKVKAKFKDNAKKLKTIEKRSDDKGVEPESVVVGKVGERFYAFIGLERSSGIMVYDVTDPANAKYIDYVYGFDGKGDELEDISPEGLKFISAANSPTGKPLLLASHEISGTTTVFSIEK